MIYYNKYKNTIRILHVRSVCTKKSENRAVGMETMKGVNKE